MTGEALGKTLGREHQVDAVVIGATGIQAVQTLAPMAKECFVFQRTPTFAIPMRNPSYDDADRARIKAIYPGFAID